MRSNSQGMGKRASKKYLSTILSITNMNFSFLMNAIFDYPMTLKLPKIVKQEVHQETVVKKQLTREIK